MTTLAKKLGPHSKIFVAGHRGLVGSAITRALDRKGFKNVVTRSRKELDLRNTAAVQEFFKTERPEFVILAAAKVGGIGANSAFPVEFLLENLQIQNNVISSAAESDVQKLIFLGSSCIYPKQARYPLTEDQLLEGPFEPTNEAYALAKVAGIKLCEFYRKQYSKNFISLMPTSMYGPNDYYDFQKSHVIPAMMLKFLKAKLEGSKTVTLWGTGKVSREFLHSDDLAEAILLCLEKYEEIEFINVGSQEETTIAELAKLICKVTGYKGEIIWDSSKPDGIARKVMDSSKIRKLGWRPRIGLEEGLRSVVPEAEKKLDDALKTETLGKIAS
jgi:GDP-L-fucose synthase